MDPPHPLPHPPKPGRNGRNPNRSGLGPRTPPLTPRKNSKQQSAVFSGEVDGGWDSALSLSQTFFVIFDTVYITSPGRLRAS